MALEIKLCRSDNTPWGFRLVGGTDFEYPITVSKVLESSLAEHSGLLDGDVIIDVNEQPASQLTHEGAHEAIMKAGNQFVLRVIRADEYRNPMNAEPADYETDSANTQGFAPITTPLGHEVPDDRSRGCESPFTLATKPYRPFSTEPIIGIPPLEEPIILDPKYQDDFTNIQLLDFEPDTIFKLPKTLQKYDYFAEKKPEITQNDFLEPKPIKFSKIIQNGFPENTIDLTVEKIEDTARNLLEENISNALKVSKEIQHNNNFEQQNICTKDVIEGDMNIYNGNEICVRQRSLFSEDMKCETNFNEETSVKSSEIVSETSKNEHINVVSTENFNSESVCFSQSDVSHVSHTEQSRPIQSLSASEVSQSECNQVLQTTPEQRESTSFETSLYNTEYSHDEKSEHFMEKSEENNRLDNERRARSVSATIELYESLEKSASLKNKDIQTKESERKSTHHFVNDKKSVKTINERAYTSAKLLKESAILRSQSIPGLQGTMYSTQQYDLFLKTFFIHLTDVMVALSRLIMTDHPLSRSASPMPPPKESVTQKTTTVVQEQDVLTEHHSRLSQFQEKSKIVDVNKIKTAHTATSSTTNKEFKRNLTSSKVKCKDSENSELDAKIDEILGQKDPLEWLAAIDEKNDTDVEITVGNKEFVYRKDSLYNQEGPIMWEGHADLISHKDLRGSMDLDINESTESRLTQKTAKNEISEIEGKNISHDSKIETNDISQKYLQEKDVIESAQKEAVELSNEITDACEIKLKSLQISSASFESSKTRITDEINISRVSPDLDESKVKSLQNKNAHTEDTEIKIEKTIQISNACSEMNKSNVESTDIPNASSEVSETKIEDDKRWNEISEINKNTKVDTIKSSDAKSEISGTTIDEIQSIQMSHEKNVQTFQETYHDTINITDAKSEINQDAIELGINTNNISEAKNKESTVVQNEFVQIIQEFSTTQETDVDVTQAIKTNIEEQIISEPTQITDCKPSLIKTKHRNTEAAVSEVHQVRNQNEVAIKTDVEDPYVPVPQTPLTDEYMFRLEIKLVESRSPSKSPVRVAKKPPKPTPQTQHEDPHIVKKPKLKASIETKIESLHSSNNNTETPITEPTFNAEIPQPTANGSSKDTTLNTIPSLSNEVDINAGSALNVDSSSGSNTTATPKTLLDIVDTLCTKDTSNTNTSLAPKSPLTSDNTVSTDNASSSNNDSSTTTHLSTENSSSIATDINSGTATASTVAYSSTKTALSTDTALATATALNTHTDSNTESTNNTSSTANILGADTTLKAESALFTATAINSYNTSSTPNNLCAETVIDTGTALGNTNALNTTIADTNISTANSLSFNIAISTATTLSTSQQHEKAQIAEDIGIVEQQLPGKEPRKPSLVNGLMTNDDAESENPINVHETDVRQQQNSLGTEQNDLETQEKTVSEKKVTKEELKMDNFKEVVIVDNIIDEYVNEDDIGKPGLSDEQIATLMSGEAEVLKGQHIIGLSKVIASHMSRDLDEDDDSSINFKKMKPQIEALKDSEVLKILNEELLKTKEEKKREERKYTTFLQRPNRPIPLSGNLWYNQPPPHQKYKVKIVKQPKPRVAPDAPKNYETGLLPWEERKLNEPPPPPIEREDPILVPEEGPEYLEALDNLPESAVPDLEETGLPTPPEPVLEADYSERTDELEFNIEGDTEDELETDFSEAQTEEEKVEMEQNKMAMNVLCNIEEAVDPNMSVEEQLAVMHSQLLALSQLPAAIQHTLEAVTLQLSKIVPQAINKTKTEQKSASENEKITVNADQENVGETPDSENHTEVAEAPPEAIDEINIEAIPEQNVAKEVIPEEREVPVESNMIKKEQERQCSRAQNIDQSKRELIAELELEHQQRQVKQRPTARVGRPKPVFGPLVPQDRPMILPGGRKWRRPKDAYNDDFIAETLTAQAEMLQGKTKGFQYESVRLPYDERINFMKFEKPEKSMDHLKDSGVYKLVHETEAPARGLEARPAMVLCESEFREKCRSVTPTMERPQTQEQHLDIPQQLQP